MSAFLSPILATLLLWWGSTCALLYLDGRDRRSYPVSFGLASALLVVALWGVHESSNLTTEAAAYCAFACGLGAWAWQIMSFYMGYITGPRTSACPPGLRGWRRFVEGVRTSLYHELAIIVFAALLVGLTFGKLNQFGLWSFLALWWMHSSAKINVYLGVPNLSEELLPDHLQYLLSFMTRRPMNLFFPVSVSLSTVVTVLLVQKAISAEANFEVAGYAMLATLMSLAVLEHWFLVTPIRANALWAFGLNASAAEAAHAERDQKGERNKLSISAPRFLQVAGRRVQEIAKR